MSNEKLGIAACRGLPGICLSMTLKFSAIHGLSLATSLSDKTNISGHTGFVCKHHLTLEAGALDILAIGFVNAPSMATRRCYADNGVPFHESNGPQQCHQIGDCWWLARANGTEASAVSFDGSTLKFHPRLKMFRESWVIQSLDAALTDSYS